MKKLAQFLMRYTVGQGFRGIQIECLADAVIEVWSHPPPPFQATVICEFNTEDYYEDEQINGSVKKVRPFDEAKQRAARIFVDLKPTANGHE